MSVQTFFNKFLRLWVPTNLITEELAGIYGSYVLANLQKINHYYDIYENGADFTTATDSDYTPADLHYKIIKMLIDKEARFLFAKPPEYFIKPTDQNETTIKACNAYQSYINNVVKANGLGGKMVKAAKDCLIGGRIAIFIDFNTKGGIKILLVPAPEFVYEVDEYGDMSKIITFFLLNDEKEKGKQRLQRKKYWLENGKCHVSEGIYDGGGNIVKTLIDDLTTNFEYIPAVVILNNALLGDTNGKSDIEGIVDYEEYYNKLSNLGIDSERQGMNPIRYVMDVEPRSTKKENLSLAAGAFWDLKSDPNAVSEGTKGNVGILEPNMSAANSLSALLDRIRIAMYEQLAVPSVTPSDLKGIVSSGKTLKAIYWDLIVRCDEKMLDWRPALEFMVKCIIDGAKYYPEIAKQYIVDPLQEVDYIITVDNQYPLPEDEAEEKEIDMSEVNAKVRSLKSYMIKWHNMTDEEANKEIQQIAYERQILEDSYMPEMSLGSGTTQ